MENPPPSSNPSEPAILTATLFAKPPPRDTSAQNPSANNASRPPPTISPACVAALAALLPTIPPQGTITHLSTRPLSTPLPPRVVELTFSAPPTLSPPTLRLAPPIRAFETTWRLEAVFQLHATQPRPSLQLAVFDMDSTLIDQEVVDELARTVGVGEEVAAITARAMEGELDFEASLRARVGLLRGVRADVWEGLKGVVTVAEGAEGLCRGLKRVGVKMAVVSGGFAPMAEWLAARLGLDYAVANHLLTDTTTNPPTLSGLLSPTHPIIDATQKQLLLRSIAASNNITLSATMAVGDGANDLPMLHAAGLGVAFRAKEKVQREAPNRLNSESLVDVLYLLGYTGGEIDELVA